MRVKMIGCGIRTTGGPLVSCEYQYFIIITTGGPLVSCGISILYNNCHISPLLEYTLYI